MSIPGGIVQDIRCAAWHFDATDCADETGTAAQVSVLLSESVGSELSHAFGVDAFKRRLPCNTTQGRRVNHVDIAVIDVEHSGVVQLRESATDGLKSQAKVVADFFLVMRKFWLNAE